MTPWIFWWAPSLRLQLPLGGDELLDGGGVHAFSSFLTGIS